MVQRPLRTCGLEPCVASRPTAGRRFRCCGRSGFVRRSVERWLCNLESSNAWALQVDPEDVAFDTDVFLIAKARAEELAAPPDPEPQPPVDKNPADDIDSDGKPSPPEPQPGPKFARFRVVGDVPPEAWNRIGTRLLTKLRAGEGLDVRFDVSVRFDIQRADSLEKETPTDVGRPGARGPRAHRARLNDFDGEADCLPSKDRSSFEDWLALCFGAVAWAGLVACASFTEGKASEAL